jgi:hypothetical protein
MLLKPMNTAKGWAESGKEIRNRERRNGFGIRER